MFVLVDQNGNRNQFPDLAALHQYVTGLVTRELYQVNGITRIEFELPTYVVESTETRLGGLVFRG